MNEFNWIEIFTIYETNEEVVFSDFTKEDKDASGHLNHVNEIKNSLNISNKTFTTILETLTKDDFESRFGHSYKDIVKVVKDNKSVTVEFLYKTTKEDEKRVDSKGFKIDLYNQLIYAYLIEAKMLMEKLKS